MNGLLIAVALGIAGAVCNFLYIRKEAEGYAKVPFVVIKKSAQINPGDVFTEEHFDRVEIPAANVGNLAAMAVPYSELPAVLNVPAHKAYAGGELLLRQDVLSPWSADIDEKLGPDQIEWQVPVDPRLFVSENYNPGDEVYFFAPLTAGDGPTPVNSNPMNPGSVEVVGPFRILSIGARKESVEVAKAAGQRNTSSGTVIVVPLNFKDQQPDPEGYQLMLMTAKYREPGLRIAKRSAYARTANAAVPGTVPMPPMPGGMP